MTGRDPKNAFTSRPRDAETWVRASDVTAQKNGARAHHFTARLTIDVTPDLRGRIKVAAFRRGTTISRIDILRAVAPGERYITVPYVRPGGETPLQISGWPKVEKVLQAIDAIEALGIDPVDAAPEHWQHVHNRVSVGERPRPYTKTRHQAWLHRRKLIS